MALCGLPWRRRRRTVPEASLAPGNGGGGAACSAQWLVEAPAAALPSHPVSAAVYSAARCLYVCKGPTNVVARLPQQLQYRDRVESPAMFSPLPTALQV